MTFTAKKRSYRRKKTTTSRRRKTLKSLKRKSATSNRKLSKKTEKCKKNQRYPTLLIKIVK